MMEDAGGEQQEALTAALAEPDWSHWDAGLLQLDSGDLFDTAGGASQLEAEWELAWFAEEESKAEDDLQSKRVRDWWANAKRKCRKGSTKPTNKIVPKPLDAPAEAVDASILLGIDSHKLIHKAKSVKALVRVCVAAAADAAAAAADAASAAQQLPRQRPAQHIAKRAKRQRSDRDQDRACFVINPFASLPRRSTSAPSLSSAFSPTPLLDLRSDPSASFFLAEADLLPLTPQHQPPHRNVRESGESSPVVVLDLDAVVAGGRPASASSDAETCMSPAAGSPGPEGVGIAFSSAALFPSSGTAPTSSPTGSVPSLCASPSATTPLSNSKVSCAPTDEVGKQSLRLRNMYFFV